MTTSFNAEKEISRLWRALHAAQFEIGRNYFRWRQVAIDLLAAQNISNFDIASKAAEFCGKDVGKTFLPRLNWLKGEAGFLLNLGKLIANVWVVEGGVAFVEESQKTGEVFIKCTRDPWPSWGKEYDVPMEELVLCREIFLKAILKDVGTFFNIPLSITIEKSIPKGEGYWLIRLYKKG